MSREDPELKAQESRLSSMNELLHWMLYGVFEELLLFDDDQLVCSYFVSCVA